MENIKKYTDSLFYNSEDSSTKVQVPIGIVQLFGLLKRE